ncbi:MAG TPA: hypothetical protein VMD49_06785 [Steroidobacteraceae bacterium]|nr:hypothetical protein [Steroidobacteraceae bacterium]
MRLAALLYAEVLVAGTADLKPDQHVANTLAVVRKYVAEHKGG